MKIKNKGKFFLILSAILFLVFVGFIICIKCIDVAPIGPNDSYVGFSTVNGFFNKLLGSKMLLYTVTDWGGAVAIIPGTIFATVGLVQLIKRKRIDKVDKNILALGIMYASSFLMYLFFQFVVVNRRPVLIDGHLEASFPSSTTVMAICFFLSAIYQVNKYIKNKSLRIGLNSFCVVYSIFLIVGRFFSGVHWFTDIIGALIISATLICFYYGLIFVFEEFDKKAELKKEDQKTLEKK